MKYKVTRQYINDAETPEAEFENLNDASLYITVKLTSYTKTMLLIYRLYKDGKLVSEHNNEKVKRQPISRAKYAHGDNDLPDNFAEPFRVTYRTTDNNEKLFAKFTDIEDARLFIESIFASGSHQYKEKPAYNIYNINQWIELIDQNSIDMKNAQGSQGKTKTLAFRPTPLSMTLTMGPKNYLVEQDDSEDDKNPE